MIDLLAIVAAFACGFGLAREYSRRDWALRCGDAMNAWSEAHNAGIDQTRSMLRHFLGREDPGVQRILDLQAVAARRKADFLSVVFEELERKS